MSSPTTEHSVSLSVPHHAQHAESAAAEPAAGRTTATGSSGRHRRPESLADEMQWRPAPRYPEGTRSGRHARETADEHHFADDVIEQARITAARVQTAAVTTGEHPHSRRATRERRAAEQVAAQAHAKAKRRGGRHARTADPLQITVRPADSVRGDRARAGRPPVTGSRRAPGTLPIENWLLMGKTRQQVLLATLVAVGLALVMIPQATKPNPAVGTLNAAGNSAVTAAPAGRATAENEAPAAKPTQPVAAAPPPVGKPSSPPAVPPSAPSAAPTTTPAEKQVIAVPKGDGPAQSLRTTGSAVVALTFDDGPDPVQTPKILKMLADNGVKATFCLVGAQVERHPEIVRQIVAAGHTLCNHTWDHSLRIGKDKPGQIAADLARTNAAIRKAVPNAQIPFFRAPGGNFTDRLVQVAYHAGMTSLYWEVDPRDWEHGKGEDDTTHVEKVITQVRKGVRPGAIVLSHDFNQPDTVAAYAELLPWLTENFELGVPTAHPPAPVPAGS